MLNTLQKELLDLVNQAASLLKEGPCSLRTSAEAYEFFHPLYNFQK